MAMEPRVSSIELSPSEGRELVERNVSAVLGISLPDFLSRLDSGEYSGPQPDSIIRLQMLVPFARN